MLKELRPAAVLFVLLTALTGVAYPLLVTAIAQWTMPTRANGSLIVRDGRAVGSTLIGQPFSDPRYFWGRPSATSPQPYNGVASSGSNAGPTNPALADAVKERIAAHRVANGVPQAAPIAAPRDAGGVDGVRPVPIDLVTASGSGLDPHISPAAAEYQVARVAAARGVPVESVRRMVAANTEPRDLGILGEARVNVLALNLALDAAAAR
jgi:K+-transporting ATPase ATPase C chain